MTTWCSPAATVDRHARSTSYGTLYQLTDDADLPRIRVHDLRHFAATTMLSSQVPLAMVSRTMRHSTLSTTTEVYGHLLHHVAQQAVDAIDSALAAAEDTSR